MVPTELQPVFLVDDDPDVGLLIEHTLRKSGVRNPLRVWTDAAQALADWSALESARPTSAQLPLFILIDLKMPHVSGFDLLAWLRDQPVLGARPKIVMTSSMDEHDASIAQEMGANGFLTKYPTTFVLSAIARFASNQESAPAPAETKRAPKTR